MRDPSLALLIAVALAVLVAIGICVGLLYDLEGWWERRARR